MLFRSDNLASKLEYALGNGNPPYIIKAAHGDNHNDWKDEMSKVSYAGFCGQTETETLLCPAGTACMPIAGNKEGNFDLIHKTIQFTDAMLWARKSNGNVNPILTTASGTHIGYCADPVNVKKIKESRKVHIDKLFLRQYILGVYMDRLEWDLVDSLIDPFAVRSGEIGRAHV